MLKPGGFHRNGKMLSLRCSLVPVGVAEDEAAWPERPREEWGGDPSGQAVPSPAGAFGGLRAKGAGDILWPQLLAGAVQRWGQQQQRLPGFGLGRGMRM